MQLRKGFALRGMGRTGWAASAWAGWRQGCLLAALGLGLAAPAQADSGHPRAPRGAAANAQAAQAQDADSGEARVIVKYRSGSALVSGSPRLPQHAATLGRRLALNLSDGRVLGSRMQALRGTGLASSQLAAMLAAQADVEWAVVDRRRRIAAVVPNDPYYADGLTSTTPAVGQWYLRAPDATRVAATNAVGAWAVTTGSPSVVVAVLDTGVRLDHPDLAGKLLPGYDFISRTTTAQDGDGRDTDASDPGDHNPTATTACEASSSSWHGTQVAGLIGAASDNGIGIAGLARDVKVLPVRVLGRCGGADSDILAGMRWAAGLSNSPYVNPNPARVINLSLGSSDVNGCDASYRDTIAELNAAGVVVVAAAGNDTGHAVNVPANCSGAIAVAGLRHAGSKVGYSNIGPQVALAAPAGNCVNTAAGSPCLYPLMTTTNDGSTSPGNNTYSSSFDATLGTSFATPLVAGAAALLLSVDPSLTPAQVKAHLQAGARAFPTTGGTDATVVQCTAPTAADQLECYCTTSTCGAGMLDVGRSVALVQQAPTVVLAASTTAPVVGQTVTLSSSGSGVASGRSIASLRWAITSGAELASLVGATDGSTATLAVSGAGAVTVQLTLTDSTGVARSNSLTLNVSAAGGGSSSGGDTGSGGGSSGGGALGGGWLAGLALAIWALGPARRGRTRTR